MPEDTGSLEDLKVAELREKAKEAGLGGTSHMRKDELVEALAGDSSNGSHEPAPGTDVIEILIADHRRVDALFKQALDDDAPDERREELAAQIIAELKLHTQVEEEIFYPALKAQAEHEDEDEAKDGVLEAYIEHGSVKELIAKIEASSPEDESYKALIQVMSEQVGHHVEEEESEMFKQARELLDASELVAIGQKVTAMKESIEAGA